MSADEVKKLELLIGAAIGAHRDLHTIYGGTSACGGGAGGMTLTQHCGVTCGRDHRHATDRAKWEAVEAAFFRRRDGDPNWIEAIS